MRARTVFPLLLFGCFVLLSAAFLLAGPGGAPAPAFAGSLAWSDLHGPAGGPAQALALNPRYPADQTVLAGGGRYTFIDSMAGHGIFRSLDGGLTWADRSGLPTGALMDVAFSPDWQSDRFALAGFWQGAWSTTDGGATWQMLSNLPSAPGYIKAVAVTAPAAGEHTLLAGGPYGGVFQSADEGATWTYNGDPGGVARFQFHPTLPNIALAATNTGLWRSSDAGLQWTRVTTATNVRDIAFAADGSAVAAFNGLAWRSDDDGATWQQVSGTAIDRLGAISLSADGAGLFAAAGSQLYRYNVAAGEFVALPVAPTFSHILRIALSPAFASDQTVLVGTYDGVWRSTDGGQTFTRSAGFVDLQVYALAADSSPAGHLYAGTENGVWRRSGSTWEPLNTGDELGSSPTVRNVALSPAYAQDQTLFATTSSDFGLGASLHRSTDRGISWQRVVTGTEYIDQVVVSPAFADDRRLYMVHARVVSSSNNGGETWAKSPFWDEMTHFARALAISPDFAQDQTLVVAGNGIYRSTDAGVTWSPAANPPGGPTGGAGSSAGRLYWSRSGKLYISLNGLWVSSDKGANWSQIVTAPDRPVMTLATGPTVLGSGEAIYLSTYDSNEADERDIAPDLFVSRDGGASWLNLGAVPGGAARLLAPVDVPDRLWAGSRGVWLLEAASMPTATPNPLRELLRNRSFETQEVWRIPITAYSAAYSQEQHFAGYWSMRTGIVDPADNVRSYSDFSQDVTLPLSTTVTLRLHRWPVSSAGAAQAAAPAAQAALAAKTLDEFYALLETSAADLQYALVIQPGNKINFLYARLDNNQAWLAETYDLSAYAGQTVRLQFGTFNDGSGSPAAQYFDVLEVQALFPNTHSWWLPVILKDTGGTVPPAQ